MTYLIQNQIATSLGMNVRVAQCAAQENAPGDPDEWAQTNRRDWAAAPGWDAAWESYVVSNPDDRDPGYNEAVITDGMILTQVQSMIGAGE